MADWINGITALSTELFKGMSLIIYASYLHTFYHTDHVVSQTPQELLMLPLAPRFALNHTYSDYSHCLN